MKKLLTIFTLLLISVLVNAQDPLNKYVVRTYKELVAGGVMVIKGDTLNNTTKMSSEDTTFVTFQFLRDSGQYVIQPFDTIGFSKSYNPTGTLAPGTLFYDKINHTVSLSLENAMLQLGAELYYPYGTINGTSDTIKNGTPVQFGGVVSGETYIVPAIADSSAENSFYMGLATEDIAPGDTGRVTYFGEIHDINTSLWPDGTTLFVSPTDSGKFVTSEPVTPNHIIIAAVVTKQGVTDGILFVRYQYIPDAHQINYDNSLSGLLATNTQNAIDELQLRKADIDMLSSNINLYPTSDVGDFTYYRMVNSPDSFSYDSPAFDLTGIVSGDDQLMATFISDSNLIVGNPGIVNVSVIGNIRKNSSNPAQHSGFYFQLYKRDNVGIETLIATSNAVGPVEDNYYVQYSASASLNNGSWLRGDRLIMRWYSNLLGGITGASYSFQLGGNDPTKLLIPVPVLVIPSYTAIGVLTATENFDGILGNEDSNVQHALETLDEIDFDKLPDTPISKIGNGGSFVMVEPGEITLEYITKSNILLTDLDSTGLILNQSQIVDLLNDAENWDIAYIDRLKWDGGATGLNAATGRTSLGGTTIGQAVFTSANPSATTFLQANAGNTVSWLTASAFRSAIGGTTIGQNVFTSPNPSAIRFLRGNADNTVSWLDAVTFRAAIGASSTTGTVTSVAAGNGMNFTTITSSGTVTMGTPSTLTSTSTNSVSAGTHSHAITNYSLSGTAGTIVLTGASKVLGAAGTLSLAGGYGDSQNPYASKTAKYVLAAPNGASGVPTFRALVASDIPALAYEPILTKGNLTESVTGLQFDATRQLIGGAATLSLTSGYVIPTTTEETNWNTAYAHVSNVSNPHNVTLSQLGFVDANYAHLAGTETFTGAKTFDLSTVFNSYVVSDLFKPVSGQQLVINAGESYGYATEQTDEYVYINAESGLQINSSPDNWVSGWSSRHTANLVKNDGTSNFPGNVTMPSISTFYIRRGTVNYLRAETAYSVLSSPSPGSIYLRPNGDINSSGQAILNSSGIFSSTDFLANGYPVLKSVGRPNPTDYNTLGFEHGSTGNTVASNFPPGAYSYGSYLSMLDNTFTAQHGGFQFYSANTTANDLYFRKAWYITNWDFGDWVKIWHTGNFNPADINLQSVTDNGNITTTNIQAAQFRTLPTNTSYNLLTRTGSASAVLYVQQGNSSGDIASFKYNSTDVNAGIEVFKISSSLITSLRNIEILATPTPGSNHSARMTDLDNLVDDLGFGGSGTQNVLPKFGTGGTYITDSRVYSVGAYVGINNTSPQWDLSIYEPTASNVGMIIQNSFTGNLSTDGLLIYVDSGGNSYIRNRENTFTAFYTNDTERARLTPDGNLWLGTTSGGPYKFFNSGSNYIGGNSVVAGTSNFGVNSSTSANVNYYKSTDAAYNNITWEDNYFRQRASGSGTFSGWRWDNSDSYSSMILTLSGELTLHGGIISGENISSLGQYFTKLTGDKISLYDNRLGLTTMYGFGIESSATYYKSPGYHRWYVGVNADGGVNDKMELSASGLTIDGTISLTSTATATNFILSSDSTLKKNIEPLLNLDWVDNIDFVSFNMKNDDTFKRYGVIAQDIEKVNHELVRKDTEGIYSVAYIDLLIAKVARQDEKIKEQEERISKLERSFEMLMKTFNTMINEK